MNKIDLGIMEPSIILPHNILIGMYLPSLSYYGWNVGLIKAIMFSPQMVDTK